MPKATYRIEIQKDGKYEYAAVVVDATSEKKDATSFMAKSMPELMANMLVALVLRDKNAGIEEPATTATTDAAPIILTPNRNIVT
jgi:hypothetical protein